MILFLQMPGTIQHIFLYIQQFFVKTIKIICTNINTNVFIDIKPISLNNLCLNTGRKWKLIKLIKTNKNIIFDFDHRFTILVKFRFWYWEVLFFIYFDKIHKTLTCLFDFLTCKSFSKAILRSISLIYLKLVNQWEPYIKIS